MKRISLLWAAMMVVLCLHAQRDVRFYMNNGEVKSVAVSRIDSMTYDIVGDALLIVLNDCYTESLPLESLDSIQYSTMPDGVYVEYADDKVQVLNPYAFDGIDVEIVGAKVYITSSMTEEIAYHLRGNSTVGAFKLYGSKKYELHLDGVSLINNDGAAVNIQCKKRGQVYLTAGTENYLADAATYAQVESEDQKGALFSEGQLVFMGDGKLSIDANYKHAVCSDDYIAVRGGSIIVASAAGDALHANDSIVIYGGSLTLTGDDDVVDSEGLIAIHDGMLQIEARSDAAKGMKSDGDILITNGVVSITTEGSAICDENGDVSYATAIKSNADYLQQGGSLTICASGTGGQGISVDSMLTISDGELSITVSGKGSSYTDSSGATDYYSVKALKSDGEMNLSGGVISCTASNDGGKCIVADGQLTIGTTADVAYPIITAITSGSALSSGSSNSAAPGGNRPGGQGGSGFNAAPKAIKGNADVVIHGGNIYTQTSADGGEGLESKANMIIRGGNIECATYDDGINAATSLTIHGGNIYCHATNNDAIDSNGSIAIYGGVVLASGASAPEGGFDCDNNSFVLNGGVVIGTGSSCSSPTSAAQYYSEVSSVTVSEGKYLSVLDGDGNTMFSYRCPNTVSRASVLLASPDFTSSSYTLQYGVTSVSSPTSSLFDGVFTTGGSISSGSSKKFTPSR